MEAFQSIAGVQVGGTAARERPLVVKRRRSAACLATKGSDGTRPRREFLQLSALGLAAAVSSRWTQPVQSSTEHADSPVVTDRVYFDVSINGKEIGKLVFGLYGKDAPDTVETFKRWVPVRSTAALPSYEDSLFYRCVPDEQLDLGRIRNLNTVTINDKMYYDFNGNILEYAPQLELESNNLTKRRRGLLIKQKLQFGPEFSITLGPFAQNVDQFTVFGQMEDGFDVLKQIEQLPIRTDRSMEPAGSVADNVFRAQKNFFTSFGQNVLHDKRAIDAYPYKILRRVEARRCGFLESS
eukprot:Plantae.Rhodophyta-Purpureofilum_apyrenoidigerum.ctg42884.p1 GENE.Plantae.Rhodophyta-Purpureofilum_apyrenoidigerum.ctg42884~~Plantae.Rhodophyta-Purpureofilum_apyrenoidigerum.ctg42884.p1  ORF type:complete len:324 (+),score=54.53 Plantae.Rhodophyta-Purpureofilum_apyrenoidigerum.ctg42884:86-973(+)